MGLPERPPFVMRGDGAGPTGLAVDLWRMLAEELDLDYAYVEVPRDAVADALARGEADLVLAVDARPDLEVAADLTQPLYTATLGVLTEGDSRIWGTLEGFASWRFARIVLGLSALLLVVGAVVWALERRRNAAQFAPSVIKGLGDGFWWAGVTLTTIGYGDKTPSTGLGRSVAMLWMLMGLAVNASLTAAIIALSGTEEPASEILSGRSVAAPEHSTTALYLQRLDADLRLVASVEEAVAALRRGEVEAAAAAAPALRHASSASGGAVGAPRVQTTRLDPQHVVIALPEGSTLRESLDRALLSLLASEAGQGVVERYLPEE